MLYLKKNCQFLPCFVIYVLTFRKSKVNYWEFYLDMWTVNWLWQLHHLCGFRWKILHFRPNTEHHILWRITTTFRTFLETSFTKCKQTRQQYVHCHPCCLQLSLFLTELQQSTGNSKFYINLNFALYNHSFLQQKTDHSLSLQQKCLFNIGHNKQRGRCHTSTLHH